MKDINGQVNNIFNSLEINGEADEKGKGHYFKSRFIQAGLVTYKDLGTILITKETLDKFIQTMVGCPVIINHENITDKNADTERVGVVSRVWYDDNTGDYWCEGVIWDKQAIGLVKNEDWKVSCAYNYVSDNTAGVYNATNYTQQFIDGEFLHLAIVENPRYNISNIAINSMKEDDMIENGGPGSGDFDHAGRPPEVGGSEPAGTGRKGKYKDGKQQWTGKKTEEKADKASKESQDKEDTNETKEINRDIEYSKKQIKHWETLIKEKQTQRDSAKTKLEKLKIGDSIDTLIDNLHREEKNLKHSEKKLQDYKEKADKSTSEGKGEEKASRYDTWDKWQGSKEDLIKKNEAVERGLPESASKRYIEFLKKGNEYEINHSAVGKFTGNYTKHGMPIFENNKGDKQAYSLVNLITEHKSPEEKKQLQKQLEKQYKDAVKKAKNISGKGEKWINEHIIIYNKPEGVQFANKDGTMQTSELVKKLNSEKDKQGSTKQLSLFNSKERNITMTVLNELQGMIERMVQNALGKDDKRAGIDKVAGIMKSEDCSDEAIRTAIGVMEKIAYDKSEAGTADNKCAKNEKEPEKEDKKEVENACVKNEDKRKLIDEIGGVLKGKVDDEVIRTIIGKAEKIAYEPSEDDKADNANEDKPEDKKEVKNSMEDLNKILYKGNETAPQDMFTPRAERLENGKKF